MFISFDFEWLSSVFAVICALPFSIYIYLFISHFLSHIQLLSVKKDQYSLAQRSAVILIGRLVLVLLNVVVLCQYLVLGMGNWTAQQLRSNGPIPNGTLHVHLWSWELPGPQAGVQVIILAFRRVLINCYAPFMNFWLLQNFYPTVKAALHQ